MKQITKLLFLLFLILTTAIQSKVYGQAQFNASAYSGCAPFTATFYNASTGNGYNTWNFGDPGSGIYNTAVNACSPTHTFATAGTYTVTLTWVVGVNTYTATATITVYPRPNPLITGQDTVCEDAVETYTATGLTGSSFYWTVNGGSIVGPANNPNVTVSWTVPGTGILTVTETSAYGCVNTKKINVLIANQPKIGNICDLGRGTSGNGNPKEHKSCLCRLNTTTISAIDINNQLMSNQIFNFQWTVLSGGYVVSGGNSNIAQIFVGAGPTMTLQLVAWNDFGCTDTQVCVFDVCPSPTASFFADTACLTGATHFNGSASTLASQIVDYTWDFGDNTQYSSNSPLATHTFATAGTHTVKLTVKYASGCVDDTIINVLVNNGNPPPIDCPGTVCHNTNHCYHTPYYAGATYNWTITGGVGTPNANGDSICVVWGNGPYGNISLHVIGGPYTCGYNSVDVPVFPSNLQITGPDTVCQGSTVQFSVPLIPGSCYGWQPSSPNITIANNPGNIINVTIPPNALGTFFVIADVRNDITCCSGRDTHWFVIQPAIHIDTIQSACEFSTHTYTSNFPVTWSVTGGSIQVSSPTSVTINWGASGTGIIYATAINPALVCQNTVIGQVTLVPLPPNPPINGPTLLCVGAVGSFNYAPNQLIAGSSWTVSPALPHTPSGNSDVVTFNTVGTYTITVKYYNNNSNISGSYACYSQSQIVVTVVDTACPTINGPTSTCIGKTETYTMTNPGNAWQWGVIGGNIVSQNPTTLVVKWGNISQGQITVQNKVCPKLCTKLVTVNAIPNGIITLGDSTCKGDTIRLYGPPGYSYVWSNLSTSSSIVVNTPNLYSLVITQNGCSDTIYKNISPIPRRPKPDVNINWHCMISPNTPVPYEMVATQNPTWSYSWSPQTATPANSDTTYLHYSTVQNSTHTVIVTNQFGCKDTASVTVTGSCRDTVYCLNPPCTPCKCSTTFTVAYNPCSGIFTYNITSGAPFSVMFWNFGDGFYSNLSSPEHWFANTGNFNVTVSGWCGCNWVSQTVTINVPYILRPKIGHLFPTACNYNTITLFKKTNSTILGTGLSHTVNWGDGPTSTITGLPQNHTYANPGTYIITYTVSATGPACTKTVRDTVTILPFKADFSFCDSGCVGQSVQLVDQSSSAYPIVHWNWNFGDATTSNLQSPFHIYAATGTYTVTLQIINQQNCTTSISHVIHITTFNPGSLTYTANGIPVPGPVITICDGGYATATAPFSTGYTYAWSNGASGYKDTIRQSGVYWVNITNNHGCIKKLGPFTVIVNPNPNATILSADSMCSSYYLALLALSGNGYSYNWSLNPGSFTDTFNPSQFSGITPGNYTSILTVTNMFGCKAKDTLNFTWLPVPVVTITPGYAAVCEGNVVTLTGTVAGPYSSLLWSTNQVVNPINVLSTGSYTLTATDIHGCQGTGYSYVQINPKPDLSNIPKGCYDLCKNQLGVAKVCGPYPLPGQSFNYNWLLNNSTVSTNQNITLNAPGNYQLIVVNTSTGCADTSDIFNVNFVAGTVANIGANSPNPTLCKGQNACITLTALNPQNGILYEWWGNNNYLGVGTSIQACTPGLYILHAFRSHCCESWDSIHIEEGDCCFNPQDTTFHLIQDSTVYTTNTWWDGKYYVAGRVFVRNKAILDMTTIDVVFDRDGEIIFEDSSIVRANNSVFRPCDMHDVWVGFTFKDSSSGYIHSNTYKNAKHAIDIATTGPEGVKITDNVFTDCNIGIRIDRASLSYNQGVTHNSFVLSDYDFKAKGLYPSYDNFGIILRSVKMNDIVSQNDFRNSNKFSQPNKFYGIYALRFSASISENKFTDMYRSIDVTSNTGVLNIENNEVEKTWKGKFASDVQIRLSNSDQPVVVFANELRNSDDVYNNSVAIFGERMNNMNIRDNNIKGFDIGIWTRRTNNCVINENDIDLAGDIGILDSLSRKIDINCNVVRLKDCRKITGTFCNSVGIFMQAGNNSNDIFTNCVFDTRRAIYLRSDGTNVPVPNVVNNYLYNYIYSGVECQNHVGGIGFAGQPGRNTFVSNNYNSGAGARDCRAFPVATITEQCNYGIISNQNVATIPCPPSTMYSSTASCGHQINNLKFYRQDQWDVCDNYTGPKMVVVVDHGKETVLDSIKLVSVDLGSLGTHTLFVIGLTAIDNNDANTFGKWVNRLETEHALDAFHIAVLKAQWAASQNNRSAAAALLQGVSTTTADDEDLKQILLTEWTRQPGTALSKSAVATMQQIDAAGRENSPLARDLIHASEGNHDYIFGKVQGGDGAQPGFTISEQAYIRVVPNPATDMASVQFMINGSANAEISMHDVTGQLIEVSAIRISEGEFRLDLKSIAKGVYFVTVYDTETKERHVTKLIKQ